MSEQPIEGKVVHVSGRGWGKRAAQLYWIDEAARLNPEAPTVAELQNAIPLEGVSDVGYSFGPFDAPVPEAMGEELRALGWSQTMEAFGWAAIDSRYRSKVLGHWPYTPADELRHRLNTRLLGRDPGEPINTRYWRNL